MPKVTGPCFSQCAQGSLANVMSFTKCRELRSVTIKPDHCDRKSDSQLSLRAMMGFLSMAWASIDASDRQSWLPLAEKGKLATFHVYNGGNLTRWVQNFAPSKAYPATESGNLPKFAIKLDAQVMDKSVLLSSRIANLKDGWGVIYFRSKSSGFDPNRSNCIIVMPTLSAGVVQQMDRPPTQGTWYYNIKAFTTDGEQSPSGLQEVMVTL